MVLYCLQPASFTQQYVIDVFCGPNRSVSLFLIATLHFIIWMYHHCHHLFNYSVDDIWMFLVFIFINNAAESIFVYAYICKLNYIFFLNLNLEKYNYWEKACTHLKYNDPVALLPPKRFYPFISISNTNFLEPLPAPSIIF